MASGKKSGKVFDAIFRPHRFHGLPSIIDPIVNKDDKYWETEAEKIEPEEPVALPEESDPTVKSKLDAARRERMNRRGYRSTLISGQTGDTRAPQTSAPLVLGRTG